MRVYRYGHEYIYRYTLLLQPPRDRSHGAMPLQLSVRED